MPPWEWQRLPLLLLACAADGRTLAVAAPGQILRLHDAVSGKETKIKISALTWDDIPGRIATIRSEREELIREEQVQAAEVARIQDPTKRAVAQNELKQYTFQIDYKSTEETLKKMASLYI